MSAAAAAEDPADFAGLFEEPGDLPPEDELAGEERGDVDPAPDVLVDDDDDVPSPDEPEPEAAERDSDD